MLWPGLKRLLPKPDTDLAREFRDVQFVAQQCTSDFISCPFVCVPKKDPEMLGAWKSIVSIEL